MPGHFKLIEVSHCCGHSEWVNLQVDLQHNVERPSAPEAAVNPVQSRLVKPVLVLDNSTPDPCPAEQGHDEDIRVPGPLVEREARPVEEAAEEDIGRDLGQGGDERCQSSGAHAEVEGEVGACVREQEGGVEEERDTAFVRTGE